MTQNVFAFFYRVTAPVTPPLPTDLELHCHLYLENLYVRFNLDRPTRNTGDAESGCACIPPLRNATGVYDSAVMKLGLVFKIT